MILKLKNNFFQKTESLLMQWLTVSLAVLFLSACSIVQTPDYFLPEVDTDDGYYLSNSPSNGSDSIFLVLSFSGGGTRAAALSYGVLEKLKQTTINIDGVERSLLDEVDLITSVSGGSFTAAYYGLYGDQIFEDYESKFLRRNFQVDLVKHSANQLLDESSEFQRLLDDLNNSSANPGVQQ